MSERTQKTYISIQEFISSWEKEIYELTNLDYFSYLLINYIGNEIETGYINKNQQLGYLYIESEDIGTLAFNIGDGFESFLENNCFGDCTLSCPTKLHEKINPEDIEFDSPQLQLFKYIKSDGLNKKQFFLTDILNYVVLDTLFDFYNYEIGLDLDDSDIGLMQFADFITSIVEIFIETKGQQYLHAPRESATTLFEKLVHDSEINWDDMLHSHPEDDNEDNEDWKLGELETVKLIQDFLDDNSMPEHVHEQDEVVLQLFKNYLKEYAGIDNIEEITYDDLEEFYVFWLVRELVLETQVEPQMVNSTLSRFFSWLDLSHEVDINNHYNALIQKNYHGFKNSILTTREYFSNNSLIEGVLASNNPEEKIVSSMFTIDEIHATGLVKVQDIFLKDTYNNVQLGLPKQRRILKGMIIDASIKPTMYGWRLINLDYVFPETARAYLH